LAVAAIQEMNMAGIKCLGVAPACPPESRYRFVGEETLELIGACPKVSE